jgi:hypothetical protein
VKLLGDEDEQDAQDVARINVLTFRADPIDLSLGSALSIWARYLRMMAVVRCLSSGDDLTG